MDEALEAAITHELKVFVAAAGRRRALVASCHVGHPAGEQVPLPPADDPGLRADLVVRAVEGLLETDGACAWLLRGGDQGRTDADAVWFAAARAGFGRHGIELPAFLVVTRHGWVDLVGGRQRRWRRVRPRATAAAEVQDQRGTDQFRRDPEST